MNKGKIILVVTIILLLIGSACTLPALPSLPRLSKTATAVPEASQAAPTQQPTIVPSTHDPSQGLVLVTGDFTYSNDFYPEGYAYEYSVALIDMTGFILRDDEWVVPVESQVLGYVDLNKDTNSGTYRLSLPAKPAGTMHDLDNNQQADIGVQVFAIEFSPNWTDGPFYEGDDIYMGWPSYLATVLTDSENDDEVIGGSVVVWAPDDKQSFPSGFGADKKLFTADDPVMALPAGYSVVVLDSEPFVVRNQPEEKLALLEPTDVAVKDFSTLSYTEAFDKLFEQLRKEYAFNGIAGKQPDWDALYAKLQPEVQKAEAGNSAYDYYLALRDFAMAFNDGHVSIDGGDAGQEYIGGHIIGGLGLSARETDDGKVIVVYLLPDGPAQQAGIQLGAEITSFNGMPIAQAIDQSEPFSPQSTAYGMRYEKLLFLFRMGMDEQVQLGYINPGGGPQQTTLTSIYEFDSLYATYMGGEIDNIVLPVEYQVLPSGVGHIKVNSNSDDLNLTYRLFKRALVEFDSNEISKIIIDLRHNFGGSSLGLAGFLTDQEIPLGSLEYYSERTGQFEPRGDHSRVLPSKDQFRFDKIVLLVDQFCYSACEIEAYGFSQVPGVEVLGQYPTAGVEAETARGDFTMPAGIQLTVPTGRFVLPDGSIFLEGVGVVPAVKIPITAEMLLAEGDAVLQYADQYISQ